MQIKITMKLYLTPLRMAVMKTNVGRVDKRNNYRPLVGTQTALAAVEIGVHILLLFSHYWK